MNDTYAKVSQKAEMEWKFSKTFMFAKFLPNRAALPPPFRLVFQTMCNELRIIGLVFRIIYYFALFVRWTKHCSFRRRDKIEKYEMTQRTEEYFNLLRKLVKSKLQIENEHLQKNEIREMKDYFEQKTKDLRDDFNANFSSLEKHITRSALRYKM